MLVIFWVECEGRSTLTKQGFSTLFFLWSDFYLEDRKFIQGLIQLSVSFVHLERENMNGAKSLLNKSIEKFQLFSGVHRNVNLESLVRQIKVVSLAYDKIEGPKDFDWNLVPDLEIL